MSLSQRDYQELKRALLSLAECKLITEDELEEELISLELERIEEISQNDDNLFCS